MKYIAMSLNNTLQLHFFFFLKGLFSPLLLSSLCSNRQKKVGKQQKKKMKRSQAFFFLKNFERKQNFFSSPLVFKILNIFWLKFSFRKNFFQLFLSCSGYCSQRFLLAYSDTAGFFFVQNWWIMKQNKKLRMIRVFPFFLPFVSYFFSPFFFSFFLFIMFT